MNSAISEAIILKFCDICNRAQSEWKAYRILFPEDFNMQSIKSTYAYNALLRLSIQSHEHFLHEICKLHDPAVQNNRINLGIDYIIRFGGWDAPVKVQLEEFQKKLNAFEEKIRTARNKILSHNDLETILDGAVLGDFPYGEDAAYFETLQQFVNVIHNAIKGADYTFYRDVDVEAEELLSILKQGLIRTD